MTKLLVETKGDFFLNDRSTGCQIEEFRPSVVVHSSFLERFISNGTVRVLENELSDEASDEAFLEFWKEDPETAVDAFVAADAGNSPDDDPAEVKKPRKAPAKKAPAKKAQAKTEESKSEEGKSEEGEA